MRTIAVLPAGARIRCRFRISPGLLPENRVEPFGLSSLRRVTFHRGKVAKARPTPARGAALCLLSGSLAEPYGGPCLRRATFLRRKAAKVRPGATAPRIPQGRRPYVVWELPVQIAVTASAQLYRIHMQTTHHAVAGIRFPKRRLWCQQGPQWLPACAPVAFGQRCCYCPAFWQTVPPKGLQGPKPPLWKARWRGGAASEGLPQQTAR